VVRWVSQRSDPVVLGQQLFMSSALVFRSSSTPKCRQERKILPVCPPGALQVQHRRLNDRGSYAHHVHAVASLPCLGGVALLCFSTRADSWCPWRRWPRHLLVAQHGFPVTDAGRVRWSSRCPSRIMVVLDVGTISFSGRSCRRWWDPVDDREVRGSPGRSACRRALAVRFSIWMVPPS